MKILKKIFSITKDKKRKEKIITILGIKIKIKNKTAILKDKIQDLELKLYRYMPKEKYDIALKDWYYEKTGEVLDIQNPQSFNEKIQWFKLNDSSQIKTTLADKYLVREWIKEKIGSKYLIPLLGVWNNFDEIDFSKLPNQFVIKCNHGCAYNIIVKDKSTFDKKKAREKVCGWMNENFAFKNGFEMHYSLISPKIIIEKYIETKNGLADYKLWCFNGKVHYIQYINERDKYYKMAFFDKKWNKQNFITNHQIIDKDIPKPKNLNKLIELAEVLSSGFKFVRVDFYLLDDGSIYFGEMTFTPASGIMEWQPKEQNYKMGKILTLENNK